MKHQLLATLLTMISTSTLAQHIQQGTLDKPDISNKPASSIYVTTSPSENGLTKGLFIHMRQVDGTAHNTDGLTVVGESAGKTLDHTNAIHGIVIANNKLNNGLPKDGAAFGALWGEAFAPIASGNISYITVGSELNVYQTKVRNEMNPYIRDPLKTKDSGHGGTIGMLINNYQGATDPGHRAYDKENIGIGNYWNDFGLAILSQSKQGRAFGYQTGLYISEVAKELIHLRGGVLDQNKQSEYGIYFSGTSLLKGAIALNNNKINLGSYSGHLEQKGDFFFDQLSNKIKFQDTQGEKEIVKASASNIEGAFLQIKNGEPSWSTNLEMIQSDLQNKIVSKDLNINMNANSGNILISKMKFTKEKPYCFSLINESLDSNDVLILNFSKNNYPDNHILQIGSLTKGKATICIYSQRDIENEISINFAKISLK